jgi:hypothetical protein
MAVVLQYRRERRRGSFLTLGLPARVCYKGSHEVQDGSQSLFAVLLRSPWWISMVIALGVAAVAFALFPQPYRGLGAMGGLPFVVIGSIALWRSCGYPARSGPKKYFEPQPP